MTRFARGGEGVKKKKPLDASSWKDLNKKPKAFKSDQKVFHKFPKDKKEKQEQRRLKRQRERQAAKVCFNCREPGHFLADCPHFTKDVDQGVGICFKCGSTEHKLAQCHSNKKGLVFAKCFICGQSGHLSKQCPDNPRGLYPNGGGCRECGSVEHLVRDCPRNTKDSSATERKEKHVMRIEVGQSADDLDTFIEADLESDEDDMGSNGDTIIEAETADDDTHHKSDNATDAKSRKSTNINIRKTSKDSKGKRRGGCGSSKNKMTTADLTMRPVIHSSSSHSKAKASTSGLTKVVTF